MPSSSHVPPPIPAVDKWPRISIVTPCYNKAEYVEETMNSVLEQGYPNLEYIVVDGGSDDGSAEIIRRYTDDLTWWTSEPDDGMYHAIQKGFERSSGTIMAWINADDILHRRSLFAVGEIFSTFPDVKWIQGRPTTIDEAGRIVQVATGLRRWSRFDYYLGNYRWIQQESTFWRRSLWEEAGGYVDQDLQYASDLELWSRFFRHAPLYVTEAVLGAFRKQSEGQLSTENMDAYLAEADRIIERERRGLSTHDQRVTQNLRWGKRLCDQLGRLRFLNSQGLWRRIRRSFVELPHVIHFSRKSQSFTFRQ